MLKRAAEFLRSVIPADPFQLLFLAGVVCLVIAHGAKWRPVEIHLAVGQRTHPFGQLLQMLGPLFIYFIIFAGAAGYFVCFWPGSHPVRRIVMSVCFPALSGICFLFSSLAYLGGPSSSVLESTAHAVAHRIHWAQTMLWELPGFQFSLAGLLLIAIFTSRLALGVSTLPLALRGLHTEDPGSWRRLQLLLWFLVSLVFLPLVLLGFLTVGVPLILTSRLPSYVQSDWFPRVSPIIEGFVILAIALAIGGKVGRAAARSSIRLPELKWALFALAVPTLIDIFISAGQYVLDRAHWASHDFGILGSPQLMSYFEVPEIWLLLLFFGAFCEEVIFRGLLQTRFIHRYGLYRGIFLVGVVWAAFHFFCGFFLCAFHESRSTK